MTDSQARATVAKDALLRSMVLLDMIDANDLRALRDSFVLSSVRDDCENAVIEAFQNLITKLLAER